MTNILIKYRCGLKASSQEIDLNEIPSHVPVGQLAVQGQPYFLVETPNKETLFGRINPGFPIQVEFCYFFCCSVDLSSINNLDMFYK